MWSWNNSTKKLQRKIKLLFMSSDSECCSMIGLQQTQKGPCHTSSLPALASSSRHWYLHIEQPQAQHPPTSTHWWQSASPPEAWDLRVRDALWCHHREAQSLFRTFPFTVPGWWNDLPTPIRNAGSLSIFKRHLKTHLFRLYLTSAPSSSS